MPHQQTVAEVSHITPQVGIEEPGEIFYYNDLAELYSPEMIKAEVGRIQDAWTRRLPHTPCPFKYEDGKMLIHQDDGSWKAEEGAVANWSRIEDQAFDRDPCPYPPRAIPDQPTIRAVVFIESNDKKRRVKPLTSEGDCAKMEAGAVSTPTTP